MNPAPTFPRPAGTMFVHPAPGQPLVIGKAPAQPMTYAGAAITGALGTALLGAVIGLALPGVKASAGAKYGALLGAASGVFNVWYLKRTRSGTRVFQQPPLAD